MGTAITKNELYREIEQTLGRVPEWVRLMPEVAVGGFWQVFRDTELGETKIPNKYKELMGLAVAGATRCRYCSLFHTEAARLHGATDDEISEASVLAGVSMMASTFLNAQQVDYERFKKETGDIINFVRKQQGMAGTDTRGPRAHA